MLYFFILIAEKSWNDWFYTHRKNDNGTVSWGSNPYKAKFGTKWEYAGVGDTYGGALESGMDNSPMYDDVPFDKETSKLLLEDVGLTGLFINDCNYLISLAKILNKEDDIKVLENRLNEASIGLSSLWSEKDGMYLNRYVNTKEFSYRLSPTLFFALFDKNIPKDHVEKLEKHYFNTDEFYGKYMIPTIARNDKSFSEQLYWRGRIWAPINFLVYLAMKPWKEMNKARCDLVSKSKTLLMQEWNENRHVHENYNAISGLGCDVESSDKFYHWGALLGIISMFE